MVQAGTAGADIVWHNIIDDVAVSSITGAEYEAGAIQGLPSKR